MASKKYINFRNFLKFCLIFLAVTGWLFSGFPQIWQNPQIPPEIHETEAAGIKQNIIVAWPYAEADIPDGWERDTTLDAYFLKSIPNAATPPGTTGGATTHTHTASNDGHTQTASHTHATNGNTPAASGTATTKAGSAGNLDAHVHSIPDSSAVTASAIPAGSTTIQPASNNPPYREVIWIYNTNGTTEIPNGAIAFFDSAGDIPVNWNATSTGLFYKGAEAASDPNSATQGSDTHTHTSDHTHTQSAASAHTSANTGQASAALGLSGGTGTDFAATTHVHSVTYGNVSWTTGSASANVQNRTTLPPFIGLVAAQNNTGSAATPDKVIAVWHQSLTPPGNWVLCGSGQTCNIDIFDRFAMATSTANLLKTGGETSHNHSATSHFHTSNHTHTLTFGSVSATFKKSAPVANTVSGPSHTHATQLSASGGANTDATTITVNTSTGETRPPFYQVAFIQYQLVISITLDRENFDYGKMNNNTASSTLTLWSGAGITATNGEMAAKFYIYGANTGGGAGSGGWDLDTTTSTPDHYVHKFCNETEDDCALSGPYGTDFIALTGSPALLKEENVAPGEKVVFQLSMHTPNSSTVYTTQNAEVTVQASAP